TARSGPRWDVARASEHRRIAGGDLAGHDSCRGLRRHRASASPAFRRRRAHGGRVLRRRRGPQEVVPAVGPSRGRAVDHRGPRRGGRRAAVYRKALASNAPFEKCHDGLPEWFGDNVDTACLAARGALVVFGTEDGRVFRSTDGGQRWTLVAENLPAVRSVSPG